MFRLLKNDNITVIKKAIFLLIVILIFTLFLTTNVKAGPAAPSFTVDPADDPPDSVNQGDPVTFTATATDSNGDAWYLAICTTEAVTGVPVAPPTCDVDKYCISSSVDSGLENSCIWTSEGSGVKNWYGFACDHSNQGLCSGPIAGSITVTTGPTDEDWPIFSLYKQNPLNNTAYSFGATYRFNSTITSTNGTAGVEFAGTNHSAFNSTGIVFNTTIIDLSAGTHSYFWWAYGNGTSHNHNTSGTRYYTIATATPTLSGSVAETPITYGTAAGYTGSESDSGDGNCIYSLKRNGVEIDTDSPVEDLTVLGVGTWNYNYSTTGCVNYSEGSDYDTLIVTKISPATNMDISGTTPIEYPATSDFSKSETNTGDGGCSYSMDRSNIVYGVGVWTFNYSTSGCDNYTAGSVTKDLTVNQNTTYVLSITGATPITYGTTTTVEGGDCPAELECSLDKSNIIYGVGVSPVTFNYSTTGNNNYSANSITKDIIITQAGDTFDVLLNGATNNATVTYPQQVNVNVSNNDTTATIDVNGTTFTSGTNYTLGVGVWFVNVSTVGNENYTSNESHWYITVNQGAGDVFMWINDSRSNFTTTNESSQNIWLNATLNVGVGDIELWLNGSLYDSGTSPLSNLTNLSLGFYNATAVYSGNQNYSSDRETWWINITEAAADSSPSVSIVYPGNINYNTNISELNYTASDDIELGKCWYSTNGGETNSSEQICGTNWTDLTSVEGSNTWTVWANDSIGQEGSDSVTFNKDTLKPSVTLLTESPTDSATYSTGATYEFNATITDTNLEIVLLEFNGVNYSATNLSADIYNVTISDLSVGTYNYYWYANDSFGNVNNSESGSYTIDKADPSPNMAISGTTPIEYGITSDFSESETNTGDGGCSYSMDLINGVYGVGVWTFNYSTTGCDNYTAGSTTKDLTVDQNTSLVLGLTATTPIEYPATTDFTGSDCPSQLSCSLNISNDTYQAGDISANYSTAGNNNYSATSAIFTVTINQNSSYVLSITGDTPITYGTTTTVEGGDCPAELSSCSLDKANAVYGVGESPVTFNYSTSGNTNYTANSITKDITINQAIPTGSLASDLGWTINESQEVIINLSESNTGDDDVTYKIYRDNVDKGTGETWTPPLGAYAYILNTTGGENYTANLSMDTQTLTVNDVTYPTISIAYPVNGTTYTTNISELNYTFTETNPGKCWWSNSSGVWNSTPENCGTNWTELTSVEGSNTWTVYINDTGGNENSTFVTFSKDTAYPSVTINSPLNQTYNTDSILFNITATDGGGISSCWYSLNSGVDNNSMTNLGNEYTDANSSMNQDSHIVNFYCNDSFNNINNSEVEYFFVDSIYPLIDYESQTKPDNSIVSQDFIYVNVTWIEDNFANVTYRLYNSSDEVNTTTYISTIYDINWTSLPNEVYTYNVTITDIVNNQNTTETRTITLDTTYPQVSIVYPQNTTYATNVSELNYTFTEISPDSCWWSNSSGVWNSTTKTCGENWTGLTSVEGSNTWIVYINDTSGNENSSSVTFFKDSVYPSIIDLTEYPSDPANYSSGVAYEFNATITDTNLEVVLIEFDGTNYTPSNIVGYVYNFSISDLSAGTYNYYWYANDTVNNVNTTGIQTYTINNATGNVSLLINDSASDQTATYGTQTNASALTLYGDVILYRNGGVVTSENNDFVTLGVGYYNYTADSSGDQNHSSATITRFVNITQISSEINLTLNGTQGNATVNQGDSIDLNCSTISGDSGAYLVLYRDGDIINNGTSGIKNTTIFSAVQEENITCVYEGTQNYTTISQTWWVNVSEIPDIISPYFEDGTPQNQTISYNTALSYDINATDIIGFDSFTVNDSRFKIDSSTGLLENNTLLSVALYNLNITINDTSNNLNSTIMSVDVVKAGDTFDVLLNGIANNLTVPYPQQVNVSVSNQDTTATIDVNGTTFTSGINYTLGAGVWFVNVSVVGDQNYSANESHLYITVNQALSVVYTYLNHSRSSMPINNNTAIWLNSTLITGDSGATLTLYNNGTIINSNASNLSNFTAFNITGLFNITTIYTATQNYTTSSETWWLTVLAVDLTSPAVSILFPANNSKHTSNTFEINYSVSDLNLESCWYSNDTYSINTSLGTGGSCLNITTIIWSEGQHNVTVWANDTSGNENSSSVVFFVDSIVPEIQFVAPTNVTNLTIGKNYIEINVTATDDSLDSIVIRLYNSTHDETNSSTTTSSPNYIKFLDLSAGIYYYNATVNDTVNNQNFTEIRMINLTIPTLTINKPRNKTYLANTSLLLKYSASYEEAVWYQINLTGSNTTIDSSVYFNTSEGSHTLYLYANNSLGTITKNVTFSINLTYFIIYYDEYKGGNRGNSTNFNEYAIDEIQNLSGIVLENNASGKISFNEVINLTDDANLSDNKADLDSYINISDNRIELDSDALPNFNTNATLYLYGLAFSNPRILRDETVCPPTICTEESYSGGTLKFNVTGFTIYSAEETPVEEVVPEAPSGPGGGGSAECLQDSDCEEKDEVCWKYKCVKLFDIKIIDFESPVKLGEFFDFTYFAKGVADINADVEVRFWIEKKGEIITSGSDVMYFGSFEEKTETTKIFLPSNLESGFYEFYVQIIHEAYTVSSHRSIEIEVKEGGIAIITPLDKEYSKIYLILVLIIVFLFISFLIIHILHKKRLKKK